MSKKAKRRRIIVKIIEHIFGVALILICIYGFCGIIGMVCGVFGVL